jgi:opacity protein-like surface antigen
MKQTLLLTFLVIICTVSFAQINKGQWLVGGATSFSTNKNDGPYTNRKTSDLKFSPNAGYFINDKLAIGARINLTRTKDESKVEPNLESTTTSINLSPFVRYYFLPKTEKLNVFADAGYDYGRAKYKQTVSSAPGGTLTSKGTSHGYSISAGPSLFLTPNTAVELTLSYNYSKQKDYDYTNKGFMTGIGFQIHLGN